MNKAWLRVVMCATAVVLAAGCRSGTYYDWMEKMGRPKRDLLVGRVETARESQQEAKRQFQSALEQFNTVLKDDHGELQSKYDKLTAVLERSQSRANAVGGHIQAIESVARALFAEWKREIAQYSNHELAESSQDKLDQTLARYNQYMTAMKRADQKTGPVIAAFHDQVLYLKHNLNAKALASMRAELPTVEENTSALIREMEASIEEANAFLSQMKADASS